MNKFNCPNCGNKIIDIVDLSDKALAVCEECGILEGEE